MTTPPRDLPARIRAALGDVTPQPTHRYLDTATAMAGLAWAARQLGLPAPQWLRTSEYVVARAGDTLLRAGHATVDDWHHEEVRIAQAWASTGCVIEPTHPGLLHPPGGLVSVSSWRWVDVTDPEPDPYAAGHTLRRLHDSAAATSEVFTHRPWRAPAKIARRLVKIAARPDDPAEPDTLLGLARATAALTATITASTGAWVPIHGDYQPGNWLAVGDRVLACDFATACLGPAGWDLTLYASRCGPGRTYPAAAFTALAAGYGQAPDPADPHWQTLQALRAVSSRVAGLSHRPGADQNSAARQLLDTLDRDQSGR